MSDLLGQSQAHASLSLTGETWIGGARVALGRRGSPGALRMAAVALLFSLFTAQLGTGNLQRAREGAKSLLVRLAQLGAGGVSAGSPLPVLERNCTLVAGAARLWAPASSIPGSPPDPAERWAVVIFSTAEHPAPPRAAVGFVCKGKPGLGAKCCKGPGNGGLSGWQRVPRGTG